MVANGLLIALHVLALGLNLESYSGPNPANDVISGIVSMAAVIPVAFALRDVVGGGPLVRRMKQLAVVAMASIVALSALLVKQTPSRSPCRARPQTLSGLPG